MTIFFIYKTLANYINMTKESCQITVFLESTENYMAKHIF